MSKQDQGRPSHGYAEIGAFDNTRPRLLASNRRLRHVQGISLRNLALTRQPTRSRGKTIDDESIPSTLRTPAKTFALRGSRHLEHSKSSADMRIAILANGSLPGQRDNEGSVHDPVNSHERPSVGKLRRRSTLDWSDAPPEHRQRKLENLVAEKLADLFFSLHCDGLEQPIYVSEVIPKTRNPTFRFFDANVYNAWITRRDEVMIKFWAKSLRSDGYQLLLELRQYLGPLQYIGKELDGFQHPFPPNCVLFHMMDGIYTSFTDLPALVHSPTRHEDSHPGIVNQQGTSSFDALMRLANLDDCIQDALSTQRKLALHINTLIAEQSPLRKVLKDAAAALSSLSWTKACIASTRKSLSISETRSESLKTSLRARREALSVRRASKNHQLKLLAAARKENTARQTQHKECKRAILRQTACVVHELFTIYPIKPLDCSSPQPLKFTIRSLALPPSHQLDDVDDDVLAAALGYVASLAHLLSQYTRFALPYPLHPQGSTSTVLDPISTTLGETHGLENPKRRFPLYRKGAVGYRYEYGVFLLGKDVEWLVGRSGRRLVDVRELAGNLNLLAAIIAAADEGTKRKVGTPQNVGEHVLDEAVDGEIESH